MVGKDAQTLRSSDVATIARTFKALSDPTRLRILGAVLHGEKCVHELCEGLKLEQSTVSHQLRVLRDRDLVQYRRDGRHIYYSLDDEHVRSLLVSALEHVGHTTKGGSRS